MRHLTAATAALLLCAGCPRPTPPPPGPPPIHVPEGCEQNLSGVYAYAERPDWRYQAQDDGGTLLMSVERAPDLLPDGGVPEGAPDAGTKDARDVSLVLTRTPEGFVGAAHATVFTPLRECPVALPTEVTACTDAGLTLSSVESVMVDSETCAVAPGPPAERKRHVLLRVPPSSPPAPDAGVDGG